MSSILGKMIIGYKLFISPILSGLGCRCRFYPSCSEYSQGALRSHPWWRAVLMIFWRVMRCGPWNAGGVDIVR